MKEAFQVRNFGEMTGYPKTRHSLDRQGRPQVLLALDGASNGADAVHVVYDERDDAYGMTFLCGDGRPAGYHYGMVSEHGGLAFEDLKPVLQEQTGVHRPLALTKG